MRTLESLKRRMNTMSSLLDVVSSMKALSAARVAQYEKSARASDEYARNVELGLQAILPEAPSSTRHEAGRVAMIAIGSDQGLVGKFNKTLALHALEYTRSRRRAEKPFIIAAGKSMAARLSALGAAADSTIAMPSSAKAITTAAKEIILSLSGLGEETEAHVFFNRRTEAGVAAERIQLLPVPSRLLERIRARHWPTRKIPMHGAATSALFSAFIRQLLFAEAHRALSLSLCAEHFTRMAAMGEAKSNIEGKLEEARIEYQSRRQSEIDAEIADVVAGATASSK